MKLPKTTADNPYIEFRIDKKFKNMKKSDQNFILPLSELKKLMIIAMQYGVGNEYWESSEGIDRRDKFFDQEIKKINPTQTYDFPTDGQIKICGEKWKDALGMDPCRLYADKDFQAGATWLRDLFINHNS